MQSSTIPDDPTGFDDWNFAAWADEWMICNEFAVAYVRERENAEIVHGTTEDDDPHTYVYDAALDRTIDPTLGQFAAYGPQYEDDWYPGDGHPVVEESARYTDAVEFATTEGGMGALNEDERARAEA